MENIRVWVFNLGGDTEGILNRMVAYTDLPLCHCELQSQTPTLLEM